jgi:phenylalanyl-tRNA synthetase beta chain
MKISLTWLRRYLPLDRSPAEIEHALTMLGFEVEGVECTGLEPIPQVVVGEVLTREPHPNADKLSVCTVRVAPDGPPQQIVCGAQNYAVGDRVPVALPGAVLPGDFKIKVSKIRGVESHGMMCSPRELGLGDDHAGLLILADRPALGLPIHEALPPGDTVFDLEITPNRPDALSHLGIARELAAWFKLPLTYPSLRSPAPPPDASVVPHLLESVDVLADEDCPLYLAIVIAGVKIGPSPAWLQQALVAVGLRPINNVVDATNFVLHETGQPLHAFDARKIAGRRLVIRRAGDGEKLVTLDDKERTLGGRMLVIADAEKPLVVAGIMGGAQAEVDATTTDLVLEAAYFRPQSVRWTAKKLGLSSDSSYRFERGVDPQGTLAAARRAVDLILETAGGAVAGPLFKVGSEPAWETEIAVSPDWIRRRAGYDIPDEAMRAALESLEMEVVVEEDSPAVGQTTWRVHIPSFRGDLDRPIDLVEEVVRLHGCENIPAAPVIGVALPEPDDPVAEFARRAGAYLVGQHFHECVNYSMRPRSEIARWISETAADALALANPLVDDQSHLRPSLLNGLLDNLRLNQDRQTGAARLFEIGRTFREADGRVWECVAVGFVLRVEPAETAWRPREAPDFYTAKNLLRVLATAAGIDFDALPAAPVERTNAGWQERHSATFGRLADGAEARCGLLNLGYTTSLGLNGPVLGGILHVLPDRLSSDRVAARRYRPFSALPPALRDLALVTDEARPAETVRRDLHRVARAAVEGKFTVESVRVFDVYRGPGLPEGTKSLAFTLTFRAPDRTLTDDEVNAALARVQEQIEQTGSYRVRK